jgi:hypothetical protein
MGTRVPESNPDMGMAAFNKQVYPTHDVLFSFAKLICDLEIRLCAIFSELILIVCISQRGQVKSSHL